MRRHTAIRQPERVLEKSEEETKLDLSKPEEEKNENEILKEIPPKELFNYNFKKLKSFKKIVQIIKLKT